jgi:hypothetical protein
MRFIALARSADVPPAVLARAIAACGRVYLHSFSTMLLDSTILPFFFSFFFPKVLASTGPALATVLQAAERATWVGVVADDAAQLEAALATIPVLLPANN